MADVRIGTGPFFERGVESVVDAPASAGTTLLPDARDLAPAVFARQAALAQLLQADNLESMLDDSVRPEIAERWLLTPQGFRAAMDAVLDLFARTAALRRGANPRIARTLDQASRVLTDEIDLREQLQMYLLALLQG